MVEYPDPAPPPVYEDACECDCQWFGSDNCTGQHPGSPPAWSDDKCANRCRVANGVDYRRCYAGATWSAKRNTHPKNVFDKHGRETWNCQYMAKNEGLGDDCRVGCGHHECRKANPEGTCLA